MFMNRGILKEQTLQKIEFLMSDLIQWPEQKIVLGRINVLYTIYIRLLANLFCSFDSLGW